MSNAQPKPPSAAAAAKTPPKAPAIIAAAVLVAAPLAMQFEGYRGAAYYDPAHILTQCYGETANVDPSVIYSKDQCATKLRARMAKDYAPKLAACLPQLVDWDRVNVFGALLDAAYNAGPGNPAKPKSGGVCNSPMAARIRAGDWAGACAAFIAPSHVGGLAVHGWYTTAKNRQSGIRTELPGLVKRRKAEAALCAPPLPAPITKTPPHNIPQNIPAPAPAPAKHVSLLDRIANFLNRLFGGAK